MGILRTWQEEAELPVYSASVGMWGWGWGWTLGL